ncbi:hypothetical protein QUB80_15905 [Chlorogloeopsis sp. ULAP01]|nr:hypothetical protein [Chlorogloeopsis sp. ULAP01]
MDRGLGTRGGRKDGGDRENGEEFTLITSLPSSPPSSPCPQVTLSPCPLLPNPQYPVPDPQSPIPYFPNICSMELENILVYGVEMYRIL